MTILRPKENMNHVPVVIGESNIEQVDSYRYLGVKIDKSLKWNSQVDYLCSKLAQRLHFLRRLQLFESSTIMLTFYNSVLGSIIRYSMAACYGALSALSPHSPTL